MHVLYSFSQRFGLPGIGTTAWHQVRELVKRGVRVTLFCGSYEKEVPDLHRVVETMRLGGLPLPYRLVGRDRAFRLHDTAVARELTRGQQRNGERYDVVHCWPLGSLATLRAAKSVGTASVLERPNTHTAFAYDIAAQEHAKLGVPVTSSHSHAFNAQRLRIEEAEYEQADVLACPSDFVAETFLKRGMNPSKIGRHQYGYDPEKFTTAPLERSAVRPFTMIFVGRCEPRKGLHYALEAWYRSGAMSAGQFIICGEYVPQYRKALKHRLNHPSVLERGYVSNVDVEMRQADVLVLPSVEEGSALVTYEARACGCVLLVSDAAGARFEHERHGFLHPAGDVERLSVQLHTLVNDPERLSSMRSASIRELDALTWTSAAKALCLLYDRSVQIRSASPSHRP